MYPAALIISRATFLSPKSTTVAFALWFATLLLSFQIIHLVIRQLKKRAGYLKEDKPRSRFSTEKLRTWTIGALISGAIRTSAVFSCASDSALYPWLDIKMKNIPGVLDLGHIMLFIICMDGIFYMVHRLLHSNRFLYKVRATILVHTGFLVDWQI